MLLRKRSFMLLFVLLIACTSNDIAKREVNSASLNYLAEFPNLSVNWTDQHYNVALNILSKASRTETNKLPSFNDSLSQKYIRKLVDTSHLSFLSDTAIWFEERIVKANNITASVIDIWELYLDEDELSDELNYNSEDLELTKFQLEVVDRMIGIFMEGTQQTRAGSLQELKSDKRTYDLMNGLLRQFENGLIVFEPDYVEYQEQELLQFAKFLSEKLGKRWNWFSQEARLGFLRQCESISQAHPNERIRILFLDLSSDLAKGI